MEEISAAWRGRGKILFLIIVSALVYPKWVRGLLSNFLWGISNGCFLE
jgi:hypothetical protein